MKNLLLILSLAIFVSCKASSGGNGLASPTGASNGAYWNNRVDTNTQPISFSVTNGGQTYYSSTTTLADAAAFTIPEYVDLDSDTLSTVHGEDYIELQIANKIFCKYNKVTNYFQFYGCVSSNTSVTWTIRANDSYYMSDLNSQTVGGDKNKVIMVLKRDASCVGACNMNGTIAFSYDL